MKPFEGIRILDATHVFAGPFCTYQMAWLGAEVVRVEAVESLDFIRYLSPDREMAAKGMADPFLIQNANKASIALDLKEPRGQALFRKLAGRSDVVTENFRPGAMARLGLGPDELRRENPRLIYCSVSGFGQNGPLKDVPAYDHFMQGISGMMSLQGDESTGPMRVGFPVIDYVAGLVAAFALTSALYRRQVTGEGQVLDVAMLDAAMIVMAPAIGPWLASRRMPQKTGRIAASGSPFSGMFETADGILVVAANTPKQASALLGVVGREELADDPTVMPWQGKPELKETVQPMLAEIFLTRTAAEWEALLAPAGVPAGKLRDVAEISAHEQVAARGLIRHVGDVPGLGRGIDVLGPGFLFGDAEAVVAEPTPPPLKGADTRRYLREAGLSDAEIDGLIRDGVAAEPD